MNVFRSRKKSMSEADSGGRPSLDIVPPMPKSSRTLFGRKKQAQEEPKQELDLTSVLPSDNEFRTSLIMPNLSQRFSMLREQDDPSSKLGKASDDSVLFPKRHSRLNLFEGSLDDIAEVSSITGSFRPPFAQEGRDSYASDGGYDSDGGAGSIMSRAKPNQGNKFFGGRQKVYKIPAAGSASRNNSRPGSAGRDRAKMGRAVYEDDISTSLWQKLKQEERSKLSFDYDRNERIDGRGSPSLGSYNRNRETSSSTNSNERNSTAATSLTSMADHSSSNLPGSMIKEQARDRPLNKRLYGQNFDQQVHDQQSSALNRLNSVRNARGGFQTLAPTRTPSGAQRPGAISAVSSASSLRSGSPSPAQGPSNGFDFGLAQERQPSLLNTREIDSGYQGSPNYTPPISPAADPTLVAHLDPNDLGKATASGAFNKPKARYDEQQFAQRQLQLQSGRETPVQSSSRSETPHDRGSSRIRQGSESSIGTGGRNTGSLSRSSNGRSASRERNGNKRITGQALHGAYLAEVSDSEDGHVSNQRPSRSPDSLSHGHSSHDNRPLDQQSASTAQEDIHPAFRLPMADAGHQDVNSAPAKTHEPSTFGQQSGGLSDMVRGHLRNVSEASSVYPDSEPPEMNHEQRYAEDEDEDEGPEDEAPDSPQSALADRAREMLATAQRARANSSAQQSASPTRAPPAPPLHQQLSIDEMVTRTHHVRGPSTEAQQERDAFADELAERRRQVEQKLRSIAESRKQTDSQDGNTREGSSAGPLVKKSSRSSLADSNGPLGKFKKFMPGSASGSGSTTPVAEPDSPPHYPLGGRPPQGQLQDRAPSGPMTGDGPSAHRDIGAERRARHAEAMKSPRGSGAPPPRGRVDARRQQFAGATGNIPTDFTARTNADPDQGKPHFHPAGRARHYSPPRASQTPDQKPMLPPQAQGRGQRQVSRGPIGRSGAPMDPNQLPRQPSADRGNMITPDGFSRNQSPANLAKSAGSPTSAVQMITPGTYPAPVGSPTGGIAPSGDMKYVAARKRSVSKADISPPTFLSGTYDSRNVVDLPPGASLQNGMAEVRAADAAMAPPPVPPINPRRRAMGAIKGLARSNTGSPEEESGSRGGSPVTLRRQMSEGTTLRGGSPMRGY